MVFVCRCRFKIGTNIFFGWVWSGLPSGVDIMPRFAQDYMENNEGFQMVLVVWKIA